MNRTRRTREKDAAVHINNQQVVTAALKRTPVCWIHAGTTSGFPGDDRVYTLLFAGKAYAPCVHECHAAEITNECEKTRAHGRFYAYKRSRC